MFMLNYICNLLMAIKDDIDTAALSEALGITILLLTAGTVIWLCAEYVKFRIDDEILDLILFEEWQEEKERNKAPQQKKYTENPTRIF